jgi:transcriptional regulator with XRE-family HTH domain
MSLREIVAGNLRRLRHAKGISQEELADRADIDRNYVGKLEREENAATVDMLEKLSVVLEIDPVEFFQRRTTPADATEPSAQP